MKYGWSLAALLLLAIACASGGEEKKSKTADDWGAVDEGEGESQIDENAGVGLPPAEGAPEQCVDEQGEPVQCESDEECASCPGNFYCGLDPQGSTRQKVCIFGG